MSSYSHSECLEPGSGSGLGVEPVVWFVAQVKHSAADEWQTVGMSSDRAAAVKMAGSGYQDARTGGLGPYAARVVLSNQ
jgi:hypothetical protein